MLFSRLFDSNEKQLRRLNPLVTKVNSYEKEFEKLSQEEIQAKTAHWKQDLRKTPVELHSAYLDEILPQAFALVREASKRTLKKRHFDVQIMAGIALHEGKISEQKTGEGKTLTATLPLYLNSLTGRGVHLVTPNDYLSRHGAGWMGEVYHYLGVSVGVIMQERSFIYDPEIHNDEFNDSFAVHLKEVPRRQAYSSDITYGTNHEFGFDYLRDNMAYDQENLVQMNSNGEFGLHNFAIVDEVDSILIDMARTPLIISTAASIPTERYHQASTIVAALIKGTDFEVEEKFRNTTLTDLGVRKVEKMLGAVNLYEEDFEMVHLIEQALTARALYNKDKDYVIKDGRVVIVDQFTGRLLLNNTFSHGLHQAIEAKEGVSIREETRSIAEVSYQNYFRLYKKLSGMTGTAVTEAEEFYKIYKLDVVVLPTHNPVARKDFNDVVYKTESGKFRAVADEIAQRHKTGQPVLIGTTTVEKSQLLHELLKRRGIAHEILNAKNHEKEAKIIANAGAKGAVTVSTNMAGRGVDIILGGENATSENQEEIRTLGGLHVIGTERHESRRIDNQLRGRSGRQGDPGSSRFYVSLQDDLMRIFGGAQVEKLMDRFGMDETIPLEAGLVSRAIENAQKKVEGFNFDRRKQVVEMDDVINVHRDVIYKLRRKLLFAASAPDEFVEWFTAKMSEYTDFSFDDHWKNLETKIGRENMLALISQLSLPVINMFWMEHLVDMDHLREGIGLRGYAQRDPMVEYKREARSTFEGLVSKIYKAIFERLSNVSIEGPAIPKPKTPSTNEKNLLYKHAELNTAATVESKTRPTFNIQPVTAKAEAGRNDLCPCGSGKKYKKCHGR